MSDKSVLIYCNGVDDVLMGASTVAGIQVQMSFWARAFAKRGWRVFSISDKCCCAMEGIQFICLKKNWLDRIRLSVVHEFLDCFSALSRSRADVLLFRGASRGAFYMSLLCRLRGIKFVFLSASDTDFEIGRELVSGGKHNVAMYRKSIRHIDYIVTQNRFQTQCLKKNYGKDSIIIPNIWSSAARSNAVGKVYDAVWVANLRRLKRVEWFLAMAASMPGRRFAVVGGVNGNNKDYYEEIKTQAEDLENVDFLGAKPFAEVNDIVGRSRLLVCTSEFEGFPNTFLQAWAVGVPVVTTVNPNGVVTDYNLGLTVADEDGLFDATNKLLDDQPFYNQCVESIKLYFNEHHNADNAIRLLLQYIGCL